MDEILDRILALIKERGWSNSEFERRIGKSTGTVNAWKTKKASPKKYLAKVAETLGTTEAYLCGETTDVSRPTPNADPDVFSKKSNTTPQHSATAHKIATAYDKAQPSIQAAARAMLGIEEDVSSAHVPIQYAARGGATGSGTVDAALAEKHKKIAKEVLEKQKDDFGD